MNKFYLPIMFMLFFATLITVTCYQGLQINAIKKQIDTTDKETLKFANSQNTINEKILEFAKSQSTLNEKIVTFIDIQSTLNTEQGKFNKLVFERINND